MLPGKPVLGGNRPAIQPPRPPVNATPTRFQRPPEPGAAGDAPAPAAPASPTAPRQVLTPEERDAAVRHPLVQQVMHEFQAMVVDVRLDTPPTPPAAPQPDTINHPGERVAPDEPDAPPLSDEEGND